MCGRPVEVRKALTRHQIETATKRRENQARKGANDRERRHRDDRSDDRPRGYEPRDRPPFEDRRGGHYERGYDRYDPYARDRSPPRSGGYGSYDRGYDRHSLKLDIFFEKLMILFHSDSLAKIFICGRDFETKFRFSTKIFFYF